MKKRMNILGTVLAGGILAALSGTVMGDSVDETMVRAGAEEVRSLRVHFIRSEMATAEGMAGLQHRIERAAKEVCGPLGAREAGGLRLAARNYQCYKNAVGSALSQIHAGNLALSD